MTVGDGDGVGLDLLQRLRSFGIYRMWRNDILPNDAVLGICLQSAWDIGGDDAVEGFLDDTVLADRATVLRVYIVTNKVLETKPQFGGSRNGSDHDGDLHPWWV